MDSRLAWGKLRTTRPLNVNHPLHPLAQVPPHPVAAPRRLQLPHHQPPVVHPLHLLRSMCGIVRANLKSMKRSRGASFFRPIWNTPGQTSSAAYFLLVPFFAAQKARRRYKEPNKAHTHRSSSKIIYSDTSRRRVSTGVNHICYSEYSTGANHSKIGLPYLYGAYRWQFCILRREMSRGDKYTEECWCCVLACLGG